LPKAEIAKPAPSSKIEISPPNPFITKETNRAVPNNNFGQKQETFAKVQVSKLNTYNHPNGIFSLDIPEGWTKNDTSNPKEVIVSWVDPIGNVRIVMNIFEIDMNPSKDDLGKELKNLIKGLIDKQPKFTISDPKEQPGGAMQLDWSYEVNLQGRSGIILGNSSIEQKGNKVMILSVEFPKEQSDGLKDSLNKIISSRKINPEVKLEQ